MHDHITKEAFDAANRRYEQAVREAVEAGQHPEKARCEAYAQLCIDLGNELLTPIAAGSLFARSGETIRTAVRNRTLYAPFTVEITGKSVNLIDLHSAVKYWGEPHDFTARLAELRKNGTTMAVGGMGYLILHVEPILQTTE